MGKLTGKPVTPLYLKSSMPMVFRYQDDKMYILNRKDLAQWSVLPKISLHLKMGCLSIPNTNERSVRRFCFYCFLILGPSALN